MKMMMKVDPEADANSNEVLNMVAPLAPSQLAPPNINVSVSVDHELQSDLDRIPQKMAFRIGEVADLLNVKTYVLRYWESEFEALKPKKSKHNQRMYERRDVETLMLIKKLLYRDKFSIEGAKSALKKLRKDNQRVKEIRTLSERLEDVRSKAEDLVDDIRALRTRFRL